MYGRKQALREQQAGELKRLKNLKRAELSKKLTAVNKACVTKEGAGLSPLPCRALAFPHPLPLPTPACIVFVRVVAT